MKIKDLCVSERPRERLLAHGAATLSNGELLAILIRDGMPGKNATDIAQMLLRAHDGNLAALFSLSGEKLQETPGIGPGKAACILAAFELGRRFVREYNGILRKPLVSARQIYELMLPQLKGLRHEECWAILLNGHNYVLSRERVGEGSRLATIIDEQRIIRLAIEKGASALALVHNHPDGNPNPSQADICSTRRLQAAVHACSLQLVDHVILCDDSFFSFEQDREMRR
ncbi:MAG: DNA repair protein RadC [Bacteroidales bacterium]|nr:DNA repair protein RadC [Bacteroidales bacterium]